MGVTAVTMLLMVGSVTRGTLPGCQHDKGSTWLSRLTCTGLKGQPQLDHPDLEHVSHLEIRDSHIPVLTNVSAPPRNNVITNLKIDCRLETFGDHYFSNYEILQRLLLENNYIVVMNKWVKNLNLTELNLSGNSIEYIDARTLEIPTLQILDLSRNKLKDMRAHSLILSSLLQLNLSYNEITTIDTNAFTNVTSLVRLSLSSNTINNIENIFSSLIFLNWLDLSYNKISNIEFAFLENKDLGILNLRGNNVTNLNKNMFKNLHKLDRLDLSRNSIENIYSTYFNHNPIIILDISYCNINYIEAHAFPSTLSVLYLNNNQLSNITSEFKRAKGLYHLDLSNNFLVYVEDNAFEGLNICKSLSKLYMHGNKLQVEDPFNIKCKKIQRFHFTNKYSPLQTNALSFFRFTTIQQLITLSYNQICFLYSYTFLNNTEVLCLMLDNNQLTRLVNYTFVGLQSLASLHLEHNNIYFIEYDAFYGLFRIGRLNMAGNKICQKYYYLEIYGCRLCDLLAAGKYLDETELKIFDTAIPYETNIPYVNQVRRVTTDKIRNKIVVNDYVSMTAPVVFPQWDVNCALFAISAGYILPQMPPYEYNHVGYTISLAENNISKLSHIHLNGHTYFESVNISYNAISELNLSIFYPLLMLSELDIEFNNIKQLDIETLISNQHFLSKIYINGNPWDCDYLFNLLRFMEKYDIIYINSGKKTVPYIGHQINGIQCQVKQEKHRLFSRFNWRLLLTMLIPFISVLLVGVPLFQLQGKCKKCTAKRMTINVEEVELENVEVEIGKSSASEDECY